MHCPNDTTGEEAQPILADFLPTWVADVQWFSKVYSSEREGGT